MDTIKDVKHDYCNGCDTLFNDGLRQYNFPSPGIKQDEIHCVYAKHNDDKSCPCSDCLIKGMCVQACPPREVWADFIIETKMHFDDEDVEC